jgi:hypothetical protein
MQVILARGPLFQEFEKKKNPDSWRSPEQSGILKKILLGGGPLAKFGSTIEKNKKQKKPWNLGYLNFKPVIYLFTYSDFFPQFLCETLKWAFPVPFKVPPH